MNTPHTRAAARARSPWSLLAPVLLLVLSLGAAMWWTGQTLVLRQTLSEGRTVADMVENIGRWASQYGGVHAKTTGTDAKIPGNFLTRAVYSVSDNDAAVLQGALVKTATGEQAALARVEAYHWKNPALIQREVADVVAASGSKARFRLTARTVLNTNNAPDAFEREALDAVQAAAATGDKTPEYWTVKSGTLLYARSMVAQASCLRCHDKPETAPDFLRTNTQFNGGGGFGYVAGKPAGLISVKVPLLDPVDAMARSATPQTWAALAVAALSLLWLLVNVWRARRG
jgi:Protein of unknown function (DUF3365)